MFIVTNCCYSYMDDLYRALITAQNVERFRRISRFDARPVDPNPLPILMRAVNAVTLRCRVIFQPRWRATRFKAKT